MALKRALEASFKISFGVTDQTNPLAWFPSDGILTTASGAKVTPSSSIKQGAYWTMVRSVAEDLARMPCPVLERMADGGRKHFYEHRVHSLLNIEANPRTTAMAFRETLNFYALHYGNGYANIEWGNDAVPFGLHLVHPSRVTPTIKDGEFYYEVSSGDLGYGDAVKIDSADMVHIHSLGMDGCTGYPLYELSSEAVGLSLQAEMYAGTYYKNNARPSIVLVHPKTLAPAAIDNLREGFKKMYGGENAMGVGALGEDIKIQELGHSPEQSQGIETREFQIEEILRFGRFPTSKAGHHKRSTFTNIESLAREYVDDTLLPWATRIEQEFNRKLFLKSEWSRFYVEHNFNSLLRGDSIKRSNFYKTMVYMGAYTLNDVLRRENDNPIDPKIGDIHWIQANMLPAEKALEGQAKALGPGPNEPPSSGQPQNQEALNNLVPVLVEAIERFQKRETMAVSRKSGLGKFKFSEWAVKFFSEAEDVYVDILKTAAISLGSLLNCDQIEVENILYARAIEYCTEHYKVAISCNGINYECPPAEDEADLILEAMINEQHPIIDGG